MNLFAIRFFNGKFEMHVPAITLPAIFCIISKLITNSLSPSFSIQRTILDAISIYFSSHSHRPRTETERMTRDNDLLGFALFYAESTDSSCMLYINSLQRLGAPIIRCTTVFISIYFFL